jgi:hypothetical protein
MMQRRYESYPENADGPFYVVKDKCMICCAPEHVAPELMGFHEDAAGSDVNSHCFFRKQPTSSDEVEHAIEAIRVACCGALRYSGNDSSILDRLWELELEDRCDNPLLGLGGQGR